jgi:hypothetical protein
MDGRSTALKVIEVGPRCSADWDAMTGDDRARFCQHCQKTVHNISAMSADEVERLACESAGPLCLRYTAAADGVVLTLDYHRPRVSNWKRWSIAGLIATLLGACASAVVGRPKPQQPTY